MFASEICQEVIILRQPVVCLLIFILLLYETEETVKSAIQKLGSYYSPPLCILSSCFSPPPLCRAFEIEETVKSAIRLLRGQAVIILRHSVFCLLVFLLLLSVEPMKSKKQSNLQYVCSEKKLVSYYSPPLCNPYTSLYEL